MTSASWTTPRRSGHLPWDAVPFVPFLSNDDEKSLTGTPKARFKWGKFSQRLNMATSAPWFFRLPLQQLVKLDFVIKILAFSHYLDTKLHNNNEFFFFFLYYLKALRTLSDFP